MRGAAPWQTNRARVLRDRQTAAEAVMWRRLRGRRLGGFKFLRQAPLPPYFADFLCREIRLVVEIDGATHTDDAEIAADNARTEALQSTGYHVIRFTNADVYANSDAVCEAILVAAESLRDEKSAAAGE